MDKEQIQDELSKVGHRLAELAAEISKLERCFGVRIDMDITSVMGAAQISINVKTSGPNSLEQAKEIAADLGVELSIPTDDGPALKPEEEVSKVLEQVLKKKLDGGGDSKSN
jgi:hypothetical protein